MSESSGVSFAAIFTKATTTADGGWNVTFSVSQDEAMRIIELSEMREKVLQVAVVVVESDF